jgi:hypothetical protein
VQLGKLPVLVQINERWLLLAAEIFLVCRRTIALSRFENRLGFNTLKLMKTGKENHMKMNQDLIGKTITGVIAVEQANRSAREIWMLQFSDGTHVEFVSPSAKRALRRASRQRNSTRPHGVNELQLALNVA